MKTRIISITVLLLIALAACKKETVTQDKIPEDMKKFMELNMKLQNLRSNGIVHFRSPAGTSNKSKTLKSGTLIGGDSTIVVGDSTIITDGDSIYWDWESCAETTNYVDENGYNVTVLDYGEQGCEEWGSLVKGKIITKWKMDENGSYFEDSYENYEAYGMIMNGTFSCSSEGNWPFYDSTGTEDDYEVIFTCQENLTITYEDGETYTYVSSFKDKYTNNLYIMLEGEFEYSSSTGEKYSYKIIKPVVYNFECQNSYLPVSGIEQWEDGNNSYEIDYGDGTCDNIATVTENGTTYVVDYDEEFNEDNVQPGDSLVNY